MSKDFTILQSYCKNGCDVQGLDTKFVKLLNELSKELHFSPVLTSAYRSKEYELSRGRLGTSSHCKGLAVDIACASSDIRLKILQTWLRICGTHRIPVRIGIARTFIHIDVDRDKSCAIWVYNDLNKVLPNYN